jgi:hypothetical protein
MKNKLAENMLRFGVKNLQESDIKKIEEAVLTEQTEPIQPYAKLNPNSWKFKDDAAYTAVVSPATYPVAKLDPKMAADGVYGPWAWELIPSTGGKHQLNPNAQERVRFIAEALASIMNAQGKYTPLIYKDFNMTLQASEQVSNRLRSIQGGDAAVPYATIGDTKIGLSTEINTRGERMSQSQWEATLQLIAPAITSVIQQYVLPKTTAPKPGTPTQAVPKI